MDGISTTPIPGSSADAANASADATAEATAKLAASLGAKIAGLGFVVELDFLKGREKLKQYDVYSLLRYDK